MNQFVNRVTNYVANEILIKGLANSRTFQRFAIRTDQTLNEMKKNGTDQLNSAFEEVAKQQVRNASSKTTAAGPPTPPMRGFSGFASAFFKEIRKDLGLGK